jgi:hypothetical protein
MSSRGEASTASPGEASTAGGGNASTSQSLRYEATTRVLDRQVEILSQLRNRANILLAANAIVATLFGASALGKGHPLPLEILALIAFGLGIGACVAILWPIHDAGKLVDPNQWRQYPRWPSSERPRKWRVVFDPDDVVTFVQSTDTAQVAEISQQFILARSTNWATLAGRTKFLIAASVLLAMQIGLWSALVLV